MFNNYFSLLICLLLSFTSVNANTLLEDDESRIFFDLESCWSNSGVFGSASDYSEFTATIDNDSECGALNVIGDHLYRNNPQENMHSCTPGVDAGIAMCVGFDQDCNYNAGSDKSIRFDIELEASPNMTSTLSQLRFYELAPLNYDWINGPTGPNDYATLYGLRVLKNGVVIYEESAIATENVWNLEVFNFSNNPEFIVSETTIFNFEILPYCPVGNGASVSVWDIDNIEIIAGCDPVDGGSLSTEGETFVEICAGNGISDAFDVELSGEIGQNFQWVITDDLGTILALPPAPPFDLEGAGPGTCLIYNLAYSDGLSGLDVGSNTSDFMGNFDLSNPITVVRFGVDGGVIEFDDGITEVTICAGDGIPDPLDVGLSENLGQNMGWIITDNEANILALPPAPPFDLDGAGPGTCLIWNISYYEGLEGLAVGGNANTLEGCYDLSNPLTVVRQDPAGGILSFEDESTEVTICAGDGIPDPLNVDLQDAFGPSMAWVITDADANILALPPAPPFDLDEAGPGVCLIWNLSFYGEVSGAEVGMNANDLEGCYELSNPLTVVRSYNDAGTLAFEDGSDFTTICAGDGISDPLNVDLSSTEGQNVGWVITDDANNILALPPAPPFDLEGAGPGLCLIWSIAYDDGIELNVGNNVDDLEGCFDLSNPLSVERLYAEGGELTLADGSLETTICAGDGNGDPLDVSLSGEAGDFMAWVITDDANNILALPPAPPFDLEGAGGGTCLIWHLSFSGDIEGAEVGMNANDLSGCYDLSNPITVVREAVNGGMLETADGETQLTICADDGESDAFDVSLTGEEGENNQWIITDDTGTILGLPAQPPFDLEGAGGGACLVWNLSFNGMVNGLELMSNTSNLEGCYSLSNPITVTRLIGDACDIFFCDVDGGNIMYSDSTNSATICAGDGIPDPLDVFLDNESGPNSGWIITDADANILGLPGMPPFDLEGAGGGVCLIWHISYEDGIVGLEVGSNALEIEGCHDLSNALTVVRLTDEECDQNACTEDAGIISFADGSSSVEICAGDSIPDPLDVLLMDEDGTNFGWIITDNVGNILGLPAMPPFDLDGAGPGICLLWHVSYEDGIMGLELDADVNELEGCFDLSNPLTVTRLEGAACDNLNCNVAGGTISFLDGSTMAEICAGDGIPDPLDVELTGEMGDSISWIVTDDAGNILALPPSPPFDFDGAGPGLCLIWSVSYDATLIGLNVGSSINLLEGCFELSNQLSVQRYEGDDCDLIGCEAEGGFVTFTDSLFINAICVDDGIEDLIDVSVTGNIGSVSQWVITDASGLIVGVPATPPPFNLEGAGPGVCLIYNVSYDGAITGLTNGLNINDITGCHDLSNSVAVERLTGDDCDNLNCDAGGGSLTFDDGTLEKTICAGDSIPDPLDVILSAAVGDSMGWIITDDQLTILGLPSAPPFDLEGAGEGVCLIWHISMNGEIEGLEVGENASMLSGCFDLSNPLTVIRETGADCTGFTEDEDKSTIAFSIFPNPTSDVIYVSLDKLPGVEGKTEIFDSNGRLIMDKIGKEGDVLELNMTECIEGVYFVRTISGYSVKMKRVIKLR